MQPESKKDMKRPEALGGRIEWPDGKNFAFTVFDDTDFSTLENVEYIYSFLKDYGFRTTKSVWPISCRQGLKADYRNGGATCDDPKYLKWVKNLQDSGFEIAFHNATFHSSPREDTLKAVERFKELFGHYPKSSANHSGNKEGIYWGNYRISGFNEFIYNLLTRWRNKGKFRGHIEGDEYFWGDICREKIKYVRNFVFNEINTLKACPFMPYHNPQKPYVNYWFASSEGPNVDSFNRCISERNQDTLESEGGACIMYTHFSDGFYEDARLNGRFKFLIERLSKKNGWFVPVSTLLDYLLEVKGRHMLTRKERKHLERKWLMHKIRSGVT